MSTKQIRMRFNDASAKNTKAAPARTAKGVTGPTSKGEKLEELLNSWLPVSSVTLKAAREFARTGNLEALSQLLLSDCFLYGQLVKRLFELKGGQHFELNLEKFLGKIPPDLLAQLFEKPATSNDLSINPETEAQEVRLQQSLVACAAALKLGEGALSKGSDCFAAMFFRQLGHNLMAWNFPRLYQRALEQAAEGRDELDSNLFHLIGYTPLSVVLELFGRWGINDRIALEIGLIGGNTSEPATLAGSCALAESFAKLQSLRWYPEAPKEWPDLQNKLKRQLGPSGYETLRATVDQSLSTSLLLSKQSSLALDPLLTQEEVERQVQEELSKQSLRLQRQNKFIELCSPTVSNSLTKAYRRLAQGDGATEALEIILTESVSLAGFSKGCLYLGDGTQSNMVPTLLIGDGQMDRYQAINCQGAAGAENPIMMALFSNAPIRHAGTLIKGERVSHITGSLKSGDNQAVLFLEMNPDLVSDSDQAVLHFRAISGCLSACLKAIE